jgi:hypothetical protein
MAKKCIPGVFCIENMTLFLLFVILLFVGYFYYIHFAKPAAEQKVIVVHSPPMQTPLGAIATRQDPFNDPYAPPLKSDGYFYPKNFGDIRGIPVNIESRGLSTGYQQVGILTRTNGVQGDMILPLMGRRSMSGRDKWQYYTISNTGNINTKLPVSLNGKSCTSEYGCDNINNGDVVYVEGYSDTFRATIYENNTFQYIPII